MGLADGMEWERNHGTPVPRTDRDEIDAAMQKRGPRIVLANARIIASGKYKRDPNWVMAMNIYGLGSTYARWLCLLSGVDPDATT